MSDDLTNEERRFSVEMFWATYWSTRVIAHMTAALAEIVERLRSPNPPLRPLELADEIEQHIEHPRNLNFSFRRHLIDNLVRAKYDLSDEDFRQLDPEVLRTFRQEMSTLTEKAGLIDARDILASIEEMASEASTAPEPVEI